MFGLDADDLERYGGDVDLTSAVLDAFEKLDIAADRGSRLARVGMWLVYGLAALALTPPVAWFDE